jgi:hypothetical protein
LPEVVEQNGEEGYMLNAGDEEGAAGVVDLFAAADVYQGESLGKVEALLRRDGQASPAQEAGEEKDIG